ncbi:MAG: TIGR03546 family protein [Nitrospinaceae bacterium]
MIRQILKAFKALNSNAKPWQISLGVCFGMVLGLTPLWNLHNLILLLLAFIINLNIAVMILSFGLFSGFGYILDPYFHELGYMLLKNEALNAFWTNFFSCPVFILSNLNNSIVMGSLVISLILAVPLFLGFNLFVEKYRNSLKVFLDKVPLLKSLKVVKIYDTLMGGRG